MNHRRALFLDRPLLKLAVVVIGLAWPLTGLSRAAADADGRDPQQPATPAERQIDDAIMRIAKLDSVSADFDRTVEMLNENFTLKGSYIKAAGRRVYLQLTASGAPENKITMLHVCDGETLWDYNQMFESRAFTRLSIKPILARLDSPDLDRKSKDRATREIGFEGADTLLTELRTCFKFGVQEMKTDIIQGKPVWIMQGTWKKGPVSQEPDPRPSLSPGFLPPYLPSDATLYLGKDDYWPYKLEVAGRQSNAPGDGRRRGLNGEPIGSLRSIKKVTSTRIVLTYSNVNFNAAIPLFWFRAPTPAGLIADDRTRTMINELDEAINIEAQRKKTEVEREAATLRGPVIEIEIPPTETVPGPR
jgi:outer membrane lipoprotein-sorting protein